METTLAIFSESGSTPKKLTVRNRFKCKFAAVCLTNKQDVLQRLLNAKTSETLKRSYPFLNGFFSRHVLIALNTVKCDQPDI